MKAKKIIKIDENKCNGCGECITTCNKGGLKIIDGIAKLVKESLCGSFIDCIGDCPTGALTIKNKRLSASNTLAPNAGCYLSGRYDANDWLT
ncbi:hypothetical protein Halha_2020 [Halobacteroides halobius DSM 5150]|uniref:4Fe-4S ferredoxin-type domain-containing protein n=1 Tax=Halobacteroides halobius (strain ATCC 35273 / DSM 5150 / MD-1) TaxID=748449 RepID=L0KC25_HALHC|nr:hypothetical protein [Halobacteroides halobius]AGB41919.1 hypothetical protein Halha_2020 [Halobacteroides halobius DSM 5150]